MHQFALNINVVVNLLYASAFLVKKVLRISLIVVLHIPFTKKFLQTTLSSYLLNHLFLCNKHHITDQSTKLGKAQTRHRPPKFTNKSCSFKASSGLLVYLIWQIWASDFRLAVSRLLTLQASLTIVVFIVISILFQR